MERGRKRAHVPGPAVVALARLFRTSPRHWELQTKQLLLCQLSVNRIG
jgi:hypothetical protein